MSQLWIVMRKNFIVLFKTKLFVQSLYIPIVCVILSILGKYGDDYFSICQQFWPMYQVVAVNGYVRFLMIEIVREKNERQKENQKIMGLSQFSYMSGNWLCSMIITYTLGIIYILPCMLANVYEEVPNYQLIFAYFLFLYSLVNQVYALSPFFTNSQLAGEIISILNLLFSFVYFTIYKDSIRQSLLFLYSISIFPQAAISFTLFSKSWLIQTNYGYGMSSMAISGTAYLLIYLYFDQVWPNDYGTQKKPWFIIQPLLNLCKSKKNKKQKGGVDYKEQEDIELGESLNNEQYMDSSSAQFHENIDVTNLKKAVSIYNLSKSYYGFLAVNKISFHLYEGQIFCLLGHNGAGKTTAINMLCGMINKSQGKVFVDGLDLDYNIDQIRKNIGYCSQKNILYPMLTVEQHLHFYADIKGMSGVQKAQDIEYIIQKCSLQNERKKFSVHLSGGNQRRLCLAIALIGQAKLIFLDEPTSGVDPVTRSQIWEILREVKNDGRVIVLTTHHLEEAETLADRVCIMAQGQLLALGSVDYITKQFGTGYYLKLSNKSDTVKSKQNFIQNKNMYKSMITDIIPSSLVDPQSQEYVLRVLLPFHTQHLFAQLFLALETQEDLMINLQMNSLEDAFVNIGMDEDRYLNKHSSNYNNGNNSNNNTINNKKSSVSNKKISVSVHSNNIIEENKDNNNDNKDINIDDDNNDNSNNNKDDDNNLISINDNNENSNKSSMIKNEGQIVQDNQIKFSDFSQIKVPQCLHKKASYNIYVQIQAMIKRRFAFLIKDWVNIFALFLPFSFSLLGSLYSQNNDNETQAVFAFIIFMILSLAFHSLNFVGLVIYENEKNLKYSLRVMGCKMTAYWIGNLLSELIMCIIITLCFYGFFILSEVNVKVYNLTQIEVIMHIFLLTFAMMASSFLYGKMFTTYYEAVLGLPMFMLFVVFWVQFLFISLATSDQIIWSIFQILPLLLSPLIVIFSGMSFFSYYTGNPLSNHFWLGDNPNVFYAYGFFLSLVQIVFAILTDYYDIKSLLLCKKRKNIIQQPMQLNDADVIQEDINVMNNNNNNRDYYSIKAARISKIYNNGYTAINSITFGVQKQSIFGLLGPNGAGKSTSFNILTAKDPDFNGKAFINGGYVAQTNEDIWSQSGICPQFDCLWDNLSPKDHLEIYASLKGLSGNNRKEVVEYYLKIMQLEEYQLKKSKNLSGGNKRKLSVCMSLIGGPTVQFLDEPSTGLDPIAKRFLWYTLQTSLQFRNSAILLTTHSMNEAQSLCSKIGILVNGQFACMGSPQHLSVKYGNGYRLQIKLNENVNAQDVHNRIMIGLPQAQNLFCRIKNSLTYQIHEEVFVFSQVFALIENLKSNSLIDDYSLHHADLEQIFAYFAGFQSQYVDPPKSGAVDEICNCKGVNCLRWCSIVCCCCVW